MTENEYRVREINIQYMLGFNKTFNKFGVNAFMGGNNMRRQNERFLQMEQVSIRHSLLPSTMPSNETLVMVIGKSGINSLFGSVELSYNNYLFLTGTARKDWFSVLNPEDNSIVYPSVGASFVFTDAFKVSRLG